MIHVFITSTLDYVKSLYMAIAFGSIDLIQNAATKMQYSVVPF